MAWFDSVTLDEIRKLKLASGFADEAKSPKAMLSQPYVAAGLDSPFPFSGFNGTA